ncbi:MAG: cobyrinate a,c-diamide synthase, partial [Cyanobium sp.]
ALLAEALPAIEEPLLGVFPSHPARELPSRHLGRLPPGEIADLAARSKVWAELAEQHLELDLLWPLLQPPAGHHAHDPIPSLLSAASEPGSAPLALQRTPIPVAVASDAAFHFRYPEAAELLEACGLEPRPWSPLADQPLP